jgi:hypothetical protein
MIRINLLAAERPSAKKKAAAVPGALQAYLIMGLFAGGALLACAGAWWYETARLKELDGQIAKGKKRQGETPGAETDTDHGRTSGIFGWGMKLVRSAIMSAAQARRLPTSIAATKAQ